MISPSSRASSMNDSRKQDGASHATKGGRRWRNYVSRGAVGTHASRTPDRWSASPPQRSRSVLPTQSVLDLLVQQPRDKAAAVKLMRKLLRKQGFAPDLLVNDRLRSYAAAMSEMGLSARYEQGLRRNNRLRIRISRRDGEREMQRFKSRGSTSKFLSPAPPATTLSSPTPSHIPPHAPRLPRRSVPDVASRHRGLNQG
jgi:hypothetical protein